jgi:AraC-like DNA-binding protein
MIYPAWETTLSEFPPRSRLYNLEPIGIGTANVESLTSYISRLAEAHSVSPACLVTRECYPLLNRTYLNHQHTTIDHAANGASSRAGDWVRAFESLTQYEGLRFLTCLTWSNVMSVGHFTRRNRAWCPQCLERRRASGHAIYDPLLWALEPVKICPEDFCLLKSICPHCRTAPSRLSCRFRSGYCPKCRHWLPSGDDAGETNRLDLETPESRYEIWKSKGIGELLAAASTLSAPPCENFTKSLSLCIDRVARGQISMFCGLTEVARPTLVHWRGGSHMPAMELLLKMCYRLGVSVLDFITGRLPVDVERWVASVHSNFPQARILDRKGKSDLMHQALQTALEDALEEKAPPTIREIAMQVGYASEASARRVCPELCQMIISKRRALVGSERVGWATNKRHPEETIRAELEAAIKLPSSISITEVAIRLGYKTSAALWYRAPDLCADLLRKNKEKLRASVEQASENQSITNASDLARHLGRIAGFSTLRTNFPDTCRRVLARRKVALAQCYDELRLQMQALLVEDPPPSQQEVSRRLGKSWGTLRKVAPEILRQLSDRRREYYCQQRNRKRALLREHIRDAFLILSARAAYPSRRKVWSLLDCKKPTYPYFNELWHECRREFGLE